MDHIGYKDNVMVMNNHYISLVYSRGYMFYWVIPLRIFLMRISKFAKNLHLKIYQVGSWSKGLVLLIVGVYIFINNIIRGIMPQHSFIHFKTSNKFPLFLPLILLSISFQVVYMVYIIVNFKSCEWVKFHNGPILALYILFST